MSEFETHKLRLVRDEVDEEQSPLRFPSLPDSDSSALSGEHEGGITERSVGKAEVAIREHQLDLAACVQKGGSWRVAALRIVSAEQESQNPGELIKQALHDPDTSIDDSPILSVLAASDPAMRRTIEAVRNVTTHPHKDIKKDYLLYDIYLALITDEKLVTEGE